MIRCDDPHAARRWCEAFRAGGARLGFVPTMGALHAGHLELVRRALAENAAACVSVFVNPLQFNESRDYERYPRDFDGDARLLAEAGCSMAFTGTLRDFFPAEVRPDGSFAPGALRDPGPSALGLEGALRPGHFAGVATIVARLFEFVRPDRAYFGHKDFQQTLVVRDLAREIGYPDIVVCPTSREPSGLARSSRNRLIAPEDRARALALWHALEAARLAWRAGERDPAALRARMLAVGEAEKTPFEYAEVRDPERWTPAAPRGPLERGVALVAARIGSVRLIDNLRLDRREEAP